MGQTHAVVTVGTPATYTCVTNIGQKPGKLHWRVVGMSNRDLTHAIRDTSVRDVDGGVVTTSEMTLELNEIANKISVECYNDDEAVFKVSDVKEIEIHCKSKVHSSEQLIHHFVLK